MDFTLKINGKSVEMANSTIEANGNKYPFTELLNLDKEWIFILERATIHVPYPKPLKSGHTYKVEFNLDLHIPYILVDSIEPILSSNSDDAVSVVSNRR